ncbi:MAG: sigma-70 family RNA polymerase sigma factor [Sinobacteraceae bacterium]|nr:sigma-70 family RNA polymerase sigma factor [Nevskiaceae bacterium]
MNPTAAEPQRLMMLLAAVGRGDERAFAELYRISAGHLYALLLRILQRSDWAEEALQDCFLKIWQKAETYEPSRGAPLTWLLTVARYRALDLLRMKRPETELPDDDGAAALEATAAGDDPQEGAAAAQSSERLAECMRRLSTEQRRSVLLAYFRGYSHPELARALQAPLGTVKSWVRRGLARLRECLEAQTA